ncbi:CHAT domain-containing tetratricopeptide repeat protein [Bernardetia sp. ABR2-2B]|uniref:CHAT domain-containing protein n=1 Tax=Bernardetia sp. ABR2-2B TaxID=3127472 RepID=UPI0030D5AE21
MKLLISLFLVSFSFSVCYAQNLDKLSYQELDSIGLEYLDDEKYDKAEKYLKASLFKIEEEFGKEDTLYTQVKIHLAYVYLDSYRLQEAKPLFLEARETNKKIVGKTHRKYIHSCYELANFYLESGEYTKAEPLFLEVKNTSENTSKEGGVYLSAMRGLADLYCEQYLYDKAEPIYLNLQAIIEKRVSKNHEWYGMTCEDLANLYSDTERLKESEKLYFEAMRIYEAEFGQKDEGYSSICNNLGNLYTDMKKYDKAEFYFKKAIKIDRKIFGKDSPLYADDLNNLGTLYATQGQLKKAEKLYKNALLIYQKSLGKHHPTCIMTTANLAFLYHKQGLYVKSNLYYKDAMDNNKRQIRLLFPTLSEREKQIYYADVANMFEIFTEFVSEYYPTNKKISQDLFNQQLFTKGIIFSSTQKMKKQILSSGDEELINQYQDWKKQKENYINLLQTPIKERNKAINITELAYQINELEREISKKSESFKQNTNQKEYNWQDVQQNLKENEAVVEIIHLIKYDLEDNPKDTVYVALIVSNETKESPELLVLENGNELENGAFSFYQNNIDFQLEGEESYNQYWKPIQDRLNQLSEKGYSKIYFSPDGVYHKLNLNTLLNPKTNNYLVEEQNLQLITSSRDLIEFKNKESKDTDLDKNFAEYKTFLLGYPTYNLNGTDTLKVNGTDRSLNGLQRVVGAQTVIPVLEGTKVETNEINQLFNQKNISTTLFQNKEATEENIKALQNPTILHIATHGFFIDEIPKSNVKTLQEAQDKTLLENPLLRSGLLLAGCQNPQIGEEDGILSAEEAMNLNLDKTELVVLSACETGLGDIENGEGVYGLQRAFRQAGAKTLLMSLWKVSDEATQLLMVTFYENLLNGKSKREAFKTAQLKLKEKYNEPYYWGAFVMVGE